MGTRVESTSREWKARRKRGRSRTGKSVRQSEDVMRTEIRVGKHVNPRWQEKALAIVGVPVPQTDAGGRGENPKTNGRTLVKELGKMAP